MVRPKLIFLEILQEEVSEQESQHEESNIITLFKYILYNKQEPLTYSKLTKLYFNY